MSICRQLIWLAALLLIMAGITLILLIVLFNTMGFGSNMAEDDSVSSFSPVTSRECSSSELASIWATLPRCRPRLQLMDLEINDPEIIQSVPSIIEIERCSGGCQINNQMFQACVPSQTYNKSIKVMIRTTRRSMKCAEIIVEKHEKCECGCNIQTCPSSLQELDKSSCSCNCANWAVRSACFSSSSKIWDENSCTCLCRPETIRACSTGFVFDGMDSCQCVRDIRTRINVDDTENDASSGTSTANLGILGLLIVLVLFAAICIVYLTFKLRIAGKQLKIALKNAKDFNNDTINETNNNNNNNNNDMNDRNNVSNEVALPLRQSSST